MTDGNTNPAVKAIMDDAIAKTKPHVLLADAVAMTRKGSGWKGGRLLSREEALAATRVVTEVVHRFGLLPTSVLRRDGRGSTPGATYLYFLTKTEMAAGVAADRRLAMKIAAHVENVHAVAIAARTAGAEVDEEALMAELASAVPSFLERFRTEPELDPEAELASDIGRLAAWLASHHRGFELPRFLGGAYRLDLDYDAATDAVVHVGHDVSPYAYGITPRVALRTRIVAMADAVVFLRDPAELAEEAGLRSEGHLAFYASPKLELVGRERMAICQKVGLGVTMDRGGALRMVFTIDHVAYTGTSYRGLGAGGPDGPGHLECRGIPMRSSPELAIDGEHYVEARWPLEYRCREFEAFVGNILSEEGPHTESEASYGRRIMPVTAETCRMMLEGDDRDGIATWRWFAGVTEETVLPGTARCEAGIESSSIRDRFADLLYGAVEPSLADLLRGEAERRVAAYNAFLLRSATGERRRKLDFRERMRR